MTKSLLSKAVSWLRKSIEEGHDCGSPSQLFWDGSSLKRLEEDTDPSEIENNELFRVSEVREGSRCGCLSRTLLLERWAGPGTYRTIHREPLPMRRCGNHKLAA